MYMEMHTKNILILKEKETKGKISGADLRLKKMRKWDNSIKFNYIFVLRCRITAIH